MTPDNESCRILVVSSTLAKGDLLVQKLKHLASKSNSPFEPTAPGSLADPVTIPWTISNRYYNAEVHFSLQLLSRVYPVVFKGVPALIVAWTQGEPIEEYMKTLRQAMGQHDPEVLLGVCLPDDSAGEDANDEDIDSMLMSHGFEYIDARRPFSTDKGLRADDEDGSIPNLPRVLDALSAFMWPSMTARSAPDDEDDEGKQEGSPCRQVRSQPTLDHIINRDPFAILQALEELDTEFGFGDSDSDDDDDDYRSTLKELAAMEQEFPNASPLFHSIIVDDNMTSSPTEDFPSSDDLLKPFGVSEASLKPKVSLRFDDDFSAFVTAPPEDNTTPVEGLTRLNINSGRESPDYDRLHSADPSSPFSQSGSLYHSLGSVSDLGEVEESPPPKK